MCGNAKVVYSIAELRIILYYYSFAVMVPLKRRDRINVRENNNTTHPPKHLPAEAAVLPTFPVFLLNGAFANVAAGGLGGDVRVCL